MGTDNKDLINDPNYLGWRHERLTGDGYYEFIEKFVKAFKKIFPKTLCQWEDFSKQTAFTIRDKYLNEVISFNDDIQGTGAVALAGILAAMKVKNEKVTILIGTSGQPGCFTREIVTAAAQNTDRPVILPLSNPTTKTEALPVDIYEWTDGKALVATGSPFDPVVHNGTAYRIGQMNNSFVFPGAGLGIVASGATEVLPVFFSAAAHAVAEFIKAEDLE